MARSNSSTTLTQSPSTAATAALDPELQKEVDTLRKTRNRWTSSLQEAIQLRAEIKLHDMPPNPRIVRLIVSVRRCFCFDTKVRTAPVRRISNANKNSTDKIEDLLSSDANPYASIVEARYQ